MKKQDPKRGVPAKGNPAWAAVPELMDPVPIDPTLRNRKGQDRKGKNHKAASEDAALVRRCLAGDAAAWETLYDRFHHGILRSVTSLLGPGSHDPNLIDEITARVWYSIVADNGKILTQYDPHRGARLITFFRLRARSELSRMFRTERRRLERELTAYRDKPDHHEKESGQPAILLRDFLSTLSPNERCFCGSHLLATPEDTDDATNSSPSTTGAWRMTRKIREKLSAYLDDAP